ncbi:M23 family metallopeptidase [Asanoa ferruginea]|uniref:M23 family metallopeptidase n=1 Tax=Asanoa ferruginea TaxID=53367 RepID=UPI000E26DC3E|nr:M23 family metallopeptidase [Asanoa ferruginea]
MPPEPEFGELLTRLLLGGPAADCPLLAPALREPAAAGRIDAVTRLGEPLSLVAQGAGRVEVTVGGTRYGVFYSRNADGLADRVEIYPLVPVRSAPRLLRGPVFRGVLLAVPVYLAVVIALSPSTLARAAWTVAGLAFLRGQWTNHRWDLTGVRLRPWWAGLSAAALAAGWLGTGTASFGHLDLLVAAVIVAAALPATLAGRAPDIPPLSVAHPLGPGHGGYVLQGGASRWLNHHHVHPQQRWAVDLLPVSGTLWRNSGRAPVVAPVSGTVVRAVDGYPDGPAVAPPYGNHVVIGGATRLFLCHLAEGSVAVQEGQTVSAGEVVGLVGNSGRSTEPHLHLHAVGPDGAAVPLLIEGSVPWRGRLLVHR